MVELANWQEAFLEELSSTPNEDLLDELLVLDRGDLWDGHSSSGNHWKFQETRKEFEKRLKTIGFL
jgi:hypothetical protein